MPARPPLLQPTMVWRGLQVAVVPNVPCRKLIEPSPRRNDSPTSPLRLTARLGGVLASTWSCTADQVPLGARNRVRIQLPSSQATTSLPAVTAIAGGAWVVLTRSQVHARGAPEEAGASAVPR